MKKTLVINFFAGPGAGKSSMATGLFSYLKFRGVNAEYVSEYAKDVTWEKSHNKLNNQLYISAKQHHRQWKLLGEVDVIITDSPILLGFFYGASDELRDLLVAEFNSPEFTNLNYFVKRVKPYNPKGRNQSELEARDLDDKMLDFLRIHEIPFTLVKGSWDQIPALGDKVMEILSNE